MDKGSSTGSDEKSGFIPKENQTGIARALGVGCERTKGVKMIVLNNWIQQFSLRDPLVLTVEKGVPKGPLQTHLPGTIPYLIPPCVPGAGTIEQPPNLSPAQHCSRDFPDIMSTAQEGAYISYKFLRKKQSHRDVLFLSHPMKRQSQDLHPGRPRLQS